MELGFQLLVRNVLCMITLYTACVARKTLSGTDFAGVECKTFTGVKFSSYCNCIASHAKICLVTTLHTRAAKIDLKENFNACMREYVLRYVEIFKFNSMFKNLSR